MLDQKTMREFLLHIKHIFDALGSWGDHVLPCEHLDVILEGLSNEYSPMMKSKFEPLLIGEIKALLHAHKARMKKF